MTEDEQITSEENRFKVKVFYKEACMDVCVTLSTNYVLQKRKIFKLLHVS